MASYFLVPGAKATLPFALTLLLLAACEPPPDQTIGPEAPPDPPTDTLAEAAVPTPLGSGQVLFDDQELELYAFAVDLGPDTYVAIVNEGTGAQSMRIVKPTTGHYELAFATRPEEPYRIQNDPTGIIFEISPHSGLLLRRVEE